MTKTTFSITLTVEDVNAESAEKTLLNKLDASGIEFLQFEKVEENPV